MARKKEVSTCRFCGRDTAARDEVCGGCRDGRGQALDRRGEIGRKARRVTDNPLEPEDQDYGEASSAERYHGGSIRDDL